MKDYEEELKKAIERMDAGQERILKRRKQTIDIEELEHLRSGILDEVDMMRTVKYDDNHLENKKILPLRIT